MTTTPTHPSPWRTRTGVVVVSLTVGYVTQLAASIAFGLSGYREAANALAVAAFLTFFLSAVIAYHADQVSTSGGA